MEPSTSDTQQPDKKDSSETSKDTTSKEEFKVPNKIISGTSKDSISEEASTSTSEEASTSTEGLHGDVKTDVAGCLGGNISKILIASSNTMQWLYSEPLMDEDDDDDKDYSIDQENVEDFEMNESSDSSGDDDDEDDDEDDDDDDEEEEDSSIHTDENEACMKECADVSKDISIDNKEGHAEENGDSIIGNENKEVSLLRSSLSNEVTSSIVADEKDQHMENLADITKAGEIEVDLKNNKTKPVECIDDSDDCIIVEESN